jgi:hypothetical protein
MAAPLLSRTVPVIDPLFWLKMRAADVKNNKARRKPDLESNASPFHAFVFKESKQSETKTLVNLTPKLGFLASENCALLNSLGSAGTLFAVSLWQLMPLAAES